jgi:thiol-disulfide isomerase/thioredoxin
LIPVPSDSLIFQNDHQEKVSIEFIFEKNANQKYESSISLSALLPKSIHLSYSPDHIPVLNAALKTSRDSIWLQLPVFSKKLTSSKQVSLDTLQFLLKAEETFLNVIASNLDASLPDYPIALSLKIQKKESKFKLNITINNLYRGEFHSASEKYTFFLFDNPIETKFYLSTLQTLNDSQTTETPVRYELGEPFLVNNKAFVLDSLDIMANSVLLKPHFSDKLIGYKEKYYLSDLSVSLLDTILTNRGMTTNGYKLLYFWGEWCQPCLEKMPALLATLKRTKPNLSILFVPFVFRENLIERTHQKIKDYRINYANYLDVSNYKTPCLSTVLRVNNYPTYVVLSKEHQVICRTNDLSRLEAELIALELLE